MCVLHFLYISDTCVWTPPPHFTVQRNFFPENDGDGAQFQGPSNSPRSVAMTFQPAMKTRCELPTNLTPDEIKERTVVLNFYGDCRPFDRADLLDCLDWQGFPENCLLTLGTINKGCSYEAVFRAKHTARHAASLVPFTFKKDVIKTRALLENLKTIKIYWLPLHTPQGHVVHYLEKWGTVKDQWFTVSGDGVPSSVRGFQIALDPNNPDNGSAPMARSVGKVFESQPGDRGSIPTKLANFISYFQINTQHRTLSAHSCPIGPGLYSLLDPSPFFVFHGSLKAYIW